MPSQILFTATITPATAAMEVSINGGATFAPLAFTTVGSSQQGTLTGVAAATYAVGQVQMRAVGYAGTVLSNTSVVTVAAAAATPTLTSFSPATAPISTAITLTGTGFTGATAVKVNGATANFTVLTDTSINATVPNGATSGTLSVTTPGGTATSAASLTVTASTEFVTTPTSIAKSTLTGTIYFVLYGNSIGFGSNAANINASQTYYALVLAGLQSTYGAANVIGQNYSAGGRTLTQMNSATYRDPVDAYLTSLPVGAQVILMIQEGQNTLWYLTNAAYGGNVTETAALATQSDLANHFKAHVRRPVVLITTCTPRETTPFVTPSSSDDVEMERRRAAFNAGTRHNFAAIAEAVVDIAHCEMDVNGPDTVRNISTDYYNTVGTVSDGVHPGPTGHSIISRQVLAVVQARLNTVVVAAATPTYAWKNLAGGASLTAADTAGLTVEGIAGTSFGVTAQLTKSIGIPATSSTDVTIAWGRVTYKFITISDAIAGLYPNGVTSNVLGSQRPGAYVNAAGVKRTFYGGAQVGGDTSGATAGIQVKQVVYYDRIEVFFGTSTVADYIATRDEHGALTPALNLNGVSGAPARVQLVELVATNMITSAY